MGGVRLHVVTQLETSALSPSPRYILAPYLATPEDVVSRMLELAKVGPEDVVLDLGCGDGRVVIAAARDCGARGLGVDIEPYWIEQSRANAAAAGVEDRVHFSHGDALETDLGAATVVFLYLVEWSTRLIAEELRKRCAPGTRVLSHSFAIEAQEGTRTETLVDTSGARRTLHLWVVPGT